MQIFLRWVSWRWFKRANQPMNQLRAWIYHVSIREHRRELNSWLGKKQDCRPIIVIAPGLEWDVPLFQRPQQLAMALARQKALVFYIQPRLQADQPPFRELYPGLFLCNTLVKTFVEVKNPCVYLLCWNSEFRNSFDQPRVIYDFVDDLDVFDGDPKQIAFGHQVLLQQAELVLVTAVRLMNRIQTLRPDAVLCPNGVDYEHFAAPRRHQDCLKPADMQTILESGRPVVGYYGALARWFDYELVQQVVTLRPEYDFVLIGPDHDRSLHNHPVFKLSNLHWLGIKPYAELPNYLCFMDVMMIPFLVNEVTHATSPLKLFEYMAAGKPVVVTPMQESTRYKGVLVGADPTEFALRLDEALRLKSDPHYLELIRQIAQQNTWDIRAQQILQGLTSPG